MCTKRFIQALVLTMCLSLFSTQAAIVYEVIDLGTLGGDESRALSINDFGQIVGEADGHATLFDPTGAGNNIDLGTLEDPLLLSCATSINNVGQIVGYSYGVSGESRATSFDPTGAGNNIDLGTLGGKNSRAFAINDGGQIVGTSLNADQLGGWGNSEHATRFDPTGAGENLELGLGWARGINNAGQIVGEGRRKEPSDTTNGAFLFDGNYTILGSGVANCINDAGQIVGAIDHCSATLFDPTGGGDNVNLAHSYLISGATSINNVGQIVGYSRVPFVSEYWATLFDPTGTGNNIDLNTVIDPDSGWNLRLAEDINNNGWIVGSGINPQGEEHAFLLIPKYSGGTGEPNDPHQIATAADLIALGETPEDYDKHFILTADIDLDANLPGRKVFDKAIIAPAGTASSFTGVLDGDGHTVSHLVVRGDSWLGLIGTLHGEVKNLGVVDVNVKGAGEYIGGLVGLNLGAVSHCFTTGIVRGGSEAGGLVGRSEGGEFDECICRSVTDSWSSCEVTGSSFVGGLLGLNMWHAIVARCYSIGSVRGTGQGVGGLVGSDGLILAPGGTVTDCFWDIQTSGQTTSAGGTGKTTAEMQTVSTFLEAGWDFVDETENGTDDIWWIDEGQDYPHLWWEIGD